MPYIQFVEGLMSLLFRLGEKHFSYTIDISGVGCHCNAAAYFVVAQNNPFPGKDGSHYIVRIQNYVSGCIVIHTNCFFSLLLSCPEYDAWEGNKYTIDVNCRPFIMVHGLIVLMVLDTIKIHTMAQDMTVPGWMG